MSLKKRLLKCDRRDVFQGNTDVRKLPTQGLCEFSVFIFMYYGQRYTLDSFIFFILCQNSAAETKLTIITADQHSSHLPVKQINKIGILSCSAAYCGNFFQVKHTRCVQ